MTDRELFEQALEALEYAVPFDGSAKTVTNAITAMRERLAQPEQEHVIDCPRCGHCCPQQPEQEPVIDKLGYVPAGDTSTERVDEEVKQRHEQKPPVKTYCGGKPNYCTPEQEPVAWADMDVRGEDKGLSWTPGHFHKTPLYTASQQRKPLTEKRIEELYSFWVVDCQDIVGFARAIERTVKGEA